MRWLKNDNYVKSINSYSESDWKPLLDLIPYITNTSEFGWIDDDKNFTKTGVICMSPYTKSEIVLKFIEIVYEIPIIIDFNWSAWNEGQKMTDVSFDFDTVDIPTKCKLITSIVRNDRFCDGVLIHYFENGLILNVLTSIQKQLGY